MENNKYLSPPKAFTNPRPKPARSRNRPRSMTLPTRVSTINRGGVKPKPPPKTYRWEEIRRQKAKGGYPWTYLVLWSNRRDHEYEPVMPPPPAVRVMGPGYDRYEPELGNAPREGSNSSTESRERKERKFLRPPLDDELQGMPHDGEGSEDEAMGVEEKEDAMVDDRAIAAPSPGTTTGSRTDLELNTSQVDSSALEDLPLSRSARRQQRLEQESEKRGPGAAARSIQSLRSQAGKLRTKLRSIKRPNINLPERPKFNLPERPKFNFPERPKFNLPERPKFNLPERPKFNLPERPKFNMPSRPKFNMPERPKFNLPERPKFNLPERPKFNFPSFSMPRTNFRRPLRERQQGSVDDSEEVNVHDDTPAPTASKRNYFDFRTYPRIFDRKIRHHREPNINMPTRSKARHITPPSMQYDDDEDMEFDDDQPPRKPALPPRRRSSGAQRWVRKFTELEYVDSENLGPPTRLNGSNVPFDDDDEEIRALQRELNARNSQNSEEEHSESISGFKDKDFGYAISMGPRAVPATMVDKDEDEMSIGESEQEVAHSSGSSSDRRRAGVLEEIDSDEFFLREKGISQEDVNVGRFIASEIRESFRPPPETAKESTKTEAELARSYRGTPERNSAADNKARPPRRHRATKTHSGSIEKHESTTPTRMETHEVPPHYFNTFPPNKPTRKGRRQIRQHAERQRKDHTSTLGRPSFPTAPRRKKRTRSEFVLDSTSQWSQDISPEWLNTVESQVVANEVAADVMVALMRSDPPEHEYIIPEAPAAPKRGKRQARRTPDEDARSQISEQPDPGYAMVTKTGFVEIEIKDSPVIEMQPCTPPPRRVKQSHRTPFPSIRRRKGRPLSGSGAPHYFTVPHRRSHGPPSRPVRNYSTLGPARPPRKQRRASLEDLHSASKDLQSGEVIRKMKERPLPPPPRPPRKDRETTDEAIKEDEPVVETVMKTEATESVTSPPCEEEPLQDETEILASQPEIELENVMKHTICLSSDAIHVQHEIIPETQQETAEINSGPTICVEEVVEKIEIEPSATPAASEMQAEVESQIIQQDCVTEIESHSSLIAEPTVTKPSQIEELSLETKEVEIAAPVETLQEEIVSTPPEIVSEIKSDFRESQVTEQQEIIKTESTEIEEAGITAEAVESQICIPTEQSQPESLMTQSTSTQVSITEETMSFSSETYIPVEEVCASTQTDPIPEEELLRLEQEDALRQSGAQEHISTSTQITPPPPETVPEQPVPQHPASDRPAQIDISPTTAALLQALNSGQLRIELLDVARLNVNELQAQRVSVTEMEGNALNVNDLQSRSGTLVLSSVDAPFGSLAEALVTAAQSMMPPPPTPMIFESVASQAEAPSSDTQQTQTIPVLISSESTVILRPSSQTSPSQEESASSLVASSEDPEMEVLQAESFSMPVQRSISPQPSTSRATSQTRAQVGSPIFTMEQVVALQAAAFSSARERDHSLPPPLIPRSSSVPRFERVPQQEMQEVEPGIAELGNRLARACCTATLGALRRVVTYTEQQGADMEEQTRERSGLQVALCIVLVLVAGLILIGFGGSGAPIHHHHWDFYMPK